MSLSDSAQFPGGIEFAVGAVGDEVIVWGGGQRQRSGAIKVLPKRFVHSFKPNRSNGKIAGNWRRMEATGDLHPGLGIYIHPALDTTFFKGFSNFTLHIKKYFILKS